MNAPASLRHYRSMISAVAVLALVVAGWIYGVMRLDRAIHDERESIQKGIVRNEMAEKRINELPDLEKQYAFILENESDAYTLLPDSRIVEFVESIERIAVEAGVTVSIEARTDATTVKPKAKAVAKPATETGDAPAGKTAEPKSIAENLPYDKQLRIGVKPAGSYAGVTRFLHKLETLPYALDVISIQIVSADREQFPTGAGVFSSAGALVDGTVGVSDVPDVEATYEVVAYLE